MKTIYPLAVDAVPSRPEAETLLFVIHEEATDDADGISAASKLRDDRCRSGGSTCRLEGRPFSARQFDCPLSALAANWQPRPSSVVHGRQLRGRLSGSKF
jgi:hypothetical protein